MRVLITGINGFVAGHLAERLLDTSGIEVWGQSRGATLALPQLRGRVRLAQVGLDDGEAVAALLDACRPDTIVHLAAQSFVPASFADPVGTLLANTVGQIHLCQAIIRHGLDPLLLAVGSTEEYGSVRPGDQPIGEETPLRPSSPYGVSKVAQHMIGLQYFLSHRLRIVRLRPFSHIGPRQDERFVASAFAAQIARIEQGRQEPVLHVGNLSAERDFTDVRDMVTAYMLAMQHCTPGEVYNIGSGSAISIERLLALLLEQSQAHVEVLPDPARMRPVDIPLIRADASRFVQATGWQPQIPLRQTLADMLEEWRARLRSEP